eukprot:9083031-Pyramimonas_sp.AAC.1
MIWFASCGRSFACRARASFYFPAGFDMCGRSACYVVANRFVSVRKQKNERAVFRGGKTANR